MGAINLKHTGSGSDVTLSSDGTDLLLDGTAVGGGGGGTFTIDDKTGAYTVVAGDLGKIINCTSGTFTVSLTSAATLGAGFSVTIWNTSTTATHAITIDPSGSESIDGVATLILRRGEGTQIICNGTNWETGNKKVMRGYAENLTNAAVRPVASSDRAIAIGESAVSSSPEGISFGYGATASNYYAVSLGPRAASSSVASIAIGFEAAASANSATAIGASSSATAAKSLGAGAVALGGAYASGADSFAAAIANNTSTYGATGTSSIALGFQVRASGNYSVAVGKDAVASAENAVSLGADSVASGTKSFAVGPHSTASGVQSVAIGMNTSSSYPTNAGGSASVVIGNNAASTIFATSSLALGSGANTEALRAIAIGSCTSSHADAVVIGNGASSSASDEITLGHTDQTVRISSSYTLPTSDGTANQVLTTDGSGAVTFADAGGGATDINGLSDAVADSGQKNYGLGTLSGTSYDSLNGYRNTAYGYSSGQSISTGDDNTVIGNNAGKYITTGINNTAIGSNALEALSTNNLTGSSNTAVGYNAGSSLRGTAQSNVLIGSDAGNLLQTGSYNVNIGRNASANSGGNSKTVAIGYVTYANADNATSINNSYASGDAAFAANITNNSSSYGATGVNSIAMGSLAKATGTSSVAIGTSNTASGSGSICIGSTSTSIASGTNSVAIGNQATASGSGSVVISSNGTGWGSDATALSSFALGDGAVSTIRGKFAFSSGSATVSKGLMQSGMIVLTQITSSNSPNTLNSYNYAASGTTNQVILPNNSAFAFHGTIVARQQASAGTASAAWKVEGLIRREGSAGTTVLVNSATTVLDNTPGWGLALSADTTNGGLKIEATGVASTNIRWVATINTSEVTYA